MEYSVEVDGEICMSAGRCVADLPGVFRFDHDELAELQPNPALPPVDQLIAAARACPSGAIEVVMEGPSS